MNFIEVTAVVEISNWRTAIKVSIVAFFTYHIFLYVYILLFGKGLFEGTGMGSNAIFTYFLYTCNGICSIKEVLVA